MRPNDQTDCPRKARAAVLEVLEVLERDWPAWVRSVLGRSHNEHPVE